MDAIAGLPFYGRVFSAQKKSAIEEAARQAAGDGEFTDLFVVSHGWNNDVADARELYNALFSNVATLQFCREKGAQPPGRRVHQQPSRRYGAPSPQCALVRHRLTPPCTHARRDPSVPRCRANATAAEMLRIAAEIGVASLNGIAKGE
jgi:hypothetical protein